MRRPGKISAALVGVSLIAIVLVWPSYKQENRIKGAVEFIENQVSYSEFIIGFRIVPFYPCRGDVIFDGNFRMRPTAYQSGEDIAEREQCTTERAKYMEENRVRHEELKTPMGCYAALEEKYGDEFTINEKYKACEMAIKRVKAKDKN